MPSPPARGCLWGLQLCTYEKYPLLSHLLQRDGSQKTQSPPQSSREHECEGDTGTTAGEQHPSAGIQGWDRSGSPSSRRFKTLICVSLNTSTRPLRGSSRALCRKEGSPVLHISPPLQQYVMEHKGRRGRGGGGEEVMSTPVQVCGPSWVTVAQTTINRSGSRG